jgi:hypothetical protein
LHCPSLLWGIGSALSGWTPETAPKTSDEIDRPLRLISRLKGCITPLAGSNEVSISSENRRTLHRLVQSKTAYEQMVAYLQFIHDINDWIAVQVGHDHCDEFAATFGNPNRQRLVDDGAPLACDKQGITAPRRPPASATSNSNGPRYCPAANPSVGTRSRALKPSPSSKPSWTP